MFSARASFKFTLILFGMALLACSPLLASEADRSAPATPGHLKTCLTQALSILKAVFEIPGEPLYMHRRSVEFLDPLSHEDVQFLKEWLDDPSIQPSSLKTLSGSRDLRPTPISLATESGGARLKAIRINYQKGQSYSRYLLHEYAQILDKLDDLELWVAFESHSKDSLDSALVGLPPGIRARIKKVKIESNKQEPMSLWAQDHSKPLANQVGTLVKPVEKLDSFGGDVNVFRAIQKQGLIHGHLSLFPFEGGNIVVGEQHVLVGPNFLNEVLRKVRKNDPKVTREEARQWISRELGKPVLELGYPTRLGQLKQAQYHLDLSVALVMDRSSDIAKKEVALVGSPFALLEKVFQIHPSKQMNGATFKIEMARAVQRIHEEVGEGRRPALSEKEKRFLDSVSGTPWFMIESEELKHQAIARQLETRGYEVRYLPARTLFDGRQLPQSSMSTYNYTNVILSEGHALVPDYEVPMVDEVAWQEYRKLGYELHPMKSVQNYIRLMGGIRCASETYRYPSAPADSVKPASHPSRDLEHR